MKWSARKTLMVLCLIGVAAAGALIFERQLQRTEVFRLVSTISPQSAQIRSFTSDGWRVFGRPARYWLVECASSSSLVPAGASVADEADRKYTVEEFGRQFSGETVPLGTERVWILDNPEGEVAICQSSDAKFMWIWRHGR
jgi:hypothetical protein